MTMNNADGRPVKGAFLCPRCGRKNEFHGVVLPAIRWCMFCRNKSMVQPVRPRLHPAVAVV